MWDKVSCLRKRRDGKDWALNHRFSDLKSIALTTTPLHIFWGGGGGGGNNTNKQTMSQENRLPLDKLKPLHSLHAYTP